MREVTEDIQGSGEDYRRGFVMIERRLQGCTVASSGKEEKIWGFVDFGPGHIFHVRGAYPPLDWQPHSAQPATFTFQATFVPLSVSTLLLLLYTFRFVRVAAWQGALDPHVSVCLEYFSTVSLHFVYCYPASFRYMNE